jgi:uncharacterized protein YbbC (DUF1343 family)
MGACFEQGIEVLVLDRPNPVGGLRVGGPMMEEQFMSYVGDYPIPYVYGMTIGELARMAKGTPGWLKTASGTPLPEETRKNGRLLVMPMSGWHRSMWWQDTGLAWVPTSPKIINVGSAYGYGLTGLGGVIGEFSHGIGSPYPFRLLNFPGKTPEEIAATMSKLHLAGLAFTPMSYKQDGVVKSGVYVQITNGNTYVPTELAFYMMKYAAAWDPAGNPFARAKAAAAELFNKHVGSAAWWQEISHKGAKADVEAFFKVWNEQDKKFQDASRQWWLQYPM